MLSKAERIALIIAFFLERDNAWATLEEVVDGIEEMPWDSMSRLIFHKDKSLGIFENQTASKGGLPNKETIHITKQMKRRYRLSASYLATLSKEQPDGTSQGE